MTIKRVGFSPLRTVFLGTTALALFGAPFGIPGAAARVGVTSATDGDPLGKPPAEAERVLRIGIDVQADEVITTNASDRAHLVFLDGTSLTVGPNARLTIDKFVFDPATKTGDLAITASKGVFRLVGGKISKTRPVTISTPSGTIGIRGGITIFAVQPASTTSTFIFGKDMTFNAAGQTQTVTRPGSQVTASGGGAPGAPTMVGQGGLSAQLSQLEGGSQSSGGSTGGGSSSGGNADQKAQSSGFSSGNSGQAPGAIQAPNGTPAPAAQKIDNSNTVTNALSNVQTEQQNQQGLADAKKAVQSAAPTKVIVTRGRYFAGTPYTAFNNTTLGVTPDPQKNVLLKSNGSVTSGEATLSLSDGRSITVPWRPGAGKFNVSVTDTTFGVLSGTGFVSASGDYFAFIFNNANNQKLGFIGGTPTTLAQFPTTGFATHTLTALGEAAGHLPFANDTVGGNADLKAAASISSLYSTYSSNIATVVGGAAPGDQRATSMQATISISGQGSSQKSFMGVFVSQYYRDYNNDSIYNSGGYNATYRLSATDQIGRQTSAESTFDTGAGNAIFGANADTMVYTPDSVRSSFTTNQGEVTGTSTTRTSQASFDQPYSNLSGSDYFAATQAAKTDTPTSVGATRTSRTLNGYVGGLVESRDNAGAFTTRTLGTTTTAPTDLSITTDAATNRASATITVGQFDGASTSATFQLGGTTGSNVSTSAFIDDKIYAMRDRPSEFFANTTTVSTNSGASDVQSRTALVSYNTAPTASFFSAAGVTPCTCEFMTWGWWGGDVKYGADSSYNPNGRDRISLATYVAGTLTTTVALPNTGQATYTGHAIGNVQNGANSYVAAGSYTNAWNFQTQMGAVTIGNFDGATYTGTTALTNGTVNFTGPISGAGRTGAVAGSFMSSPTDVAKGQAGTFSVTGAGYKAGGTFAAQKP
ncbi:MAG: FecR domain-containing protein [Reyranella sp.]|nr:FecR domain-containing protein [Reyranella sp.]